MFFKKSTLLLSAFTLGLTGFTTTGFEANASASATASCSDIRSPTNPADLPTATNTAVSLSLTLAEGDIITIYTGTDTPTVTTTTFASTNLTAGQNIVFTVGAGDAGVWNIGSVDQTSGFTIQCRSEESSDDVASAGSSAMTNAAARVFSEGVHTTVAGRFSGGGSFSGGASGNNVSGYASTSAMKQPQVLMAYGEDGQSVSMDYRQQSAWNAWISGEATGFADAGDAVLDGWSVVMSGGFDYRLAENIIIGLLFGYESAELDFDADASSFEGQGPTVGVYAGYQIAEGLIFDITVAHTWLDYDIKSGTASGEFDASRWLFAANLVGTIHVNDRVTIEPGVRVVYAIEDQDAFTLSDATVVASKTINSGSASFGPTIYYALGGDMPEGSRVWASVKGNYDFSDQGVTSTTLPDFDGVFSARLGAGFQTYIFETAKLDLSGEVSGLGSDEYTAYSGKVKIIVPLGGH